MLDWFDYHGHMCIAFEMLGLSVFDFLVRCRCRCRLLSHFKSYTAIIASRFLVHFATHKITARKQLRAVLARSRASHGLPDVLLR